MSTEPSWLLLHGTPLSPEVWEGVRPFLTQTGPVIAPALPRPAGTGQAQADIARRVIDSAGPQTPLHVVGHSFGGQVALEVALAAPERLASLTVLCSRVTPFPAFADTAASLRRGDPLDIDGSLTRWFMPDELAANGPVVRYARDCLIHADREIWAEDLEAIAGYDRSAALAGIDVPTTVIAAEHDRVGTPEEMRALAKSIPGAAFVLVLDASHMSQFLHPGQLAARLAAIP